MISFMKGYAIFSNEVLYNLHNVGFIDSSDTAKSLMTDDGYFNFRATQHVVGLLRKLQICVINVHKSILIRTRNGNNYIVEDSATEPTLELFKI